MGDKCLRCGGEPSGLYSSPCCADCAREYVEWLRDRKNSPIGWSDWAAKKLIEREEAYRSGTLHTTTKGQTVTITGTTFITPEAKADATVETEYKRCHECTAIRPILEFGFGYEECTKCYMAKRKASDKAGEKAAEKSAKPISYDMGKDEGTVISFYNGSEIRFAPPNPILSAEAQMRVEELRLELWRAARKHLARRYGYPICANHDMHMGLEEVVGHRMILKCPVCDFRTPVRFDLPDKYANLRVSVHASEIRVEEGGTRCDK